MQLDDLYTISGHSSQDTEHHFDVVLNTLHPLFAGHFPSQPILPGVCTLAILRGCLSLVLGCNMRFSEIRECKFTSLVDPRLCSELQVQFSLLNGSLVGTVANGEQIVLKIKAKFIPTNG